MLQTAVTDCREIGIRVAESDLELYISKNIEPF